MEDSKFVINQKLKALKESPFQTIVYGISGSVASIKAREIAEELLKSGYNVVLLPTSSALHFTERIGDLYSTSPLLDTYSYLSSANITQHQNNNPQSPIFMEFRDEDEWEAWTQREDAVLHIELRRLADLLLVAPFSANTMGKFANGLSDNLLSSVFRCWDFKKENEKLVKPVVVAPAMNTMMYEHPLTEMQLKILRDTLGVTVMNTAYKKLMCGDEGYGAMIDVKSIIEEVKSQIK